MKKINKKSGTLYGLLVRNYLGFTLVLALALAGLYGLSSMRMAQAFSALQLDKLCALFEQSDKPDARAVRRSLGKYTEVAVLDETGDRIYSTSADIPALTPGELSCIPDYDALSYTSVIPYESSAGKRILVLFEEYGGAETVSRVMVLDEQYRVLTGALDPTRTMYTARELELMSGRSSDGSTLNRRIIEGPDGKARTLVLFEKMLSGETYESAMRASESTWILFVPIYLVTAAGFITWLDRRIRRPLKELDRAIVALTEGGPLHGEEVLCSGPRELGQIGENFNRMARRLEESECERRRLDEGRRTLLADISHDLKTPITVISGYAEAVRDGVADPARVGQYLDTIAKKAENLTALIDTFHEFSKLEHPNFSISPERCDLCELTREYLADQYGEIDLAGFSLEVDIPETPVWCRVDAVQLRRVYANLLTNALRHNTLGTVIFFGVRVSGRQARITIGDNGAGISPDLAESIFEPFVKGDDARSGGGSGLGLAISRRLARAHGGDVRLVIPPRSGLSTQFEISLPLAPDQK